MNGKRIILGIIIVLVVGGAILFGLIYYLQSVMNTTIESAFSPIQNANQTMQTQVSQFLNPTPTIIPDPVSIVYEVKTLARLETIQYSVEKVITAEIGQGQFELLFGDRLLFVAHGMVIAGVDLSKMSSEDIRIEGEILYVRLPEPEVFIYTLDNQKSYVYDRETGLLTRGDVNLETSARQVAENEILKTAIEDGILGQAGKNAENYLAGFFRALGYSQVIFED